MITPQYVYRAVVVVIVDGDTLKLDIDLGLCTWVRDQRIRLLDVYAAELKAPGGPEAKAKLAGLLPVGSECIIQTVKDRKEKWGRWLGTIYNAAMSTMSINDILNGK